MSDCSASGTCQGAKVEGFCKSCSCDICGAKPPPLTIFQWKNGKVIRLCDLHGPMIDVSKIPKKDFDQVIFITP
jgi:hypothetical protein